MSGLSTADVNLADDFHESPVKSVLKFIVCAAVVFLAAGYGSMFTPGTWYARLTPPVGTPPNWVFGPVWTLLYSTMAISAWCFWDVPTKDNARAKQLVNLGLGVFLCQLILNSAWSQFFFGLHWMQIALLDILALWVMTLVTLIIFWIRTPLSGILLLPYLLWVTYAVYLNIGFWVLNGN